MPNSVDLIRAARERFNIAIEYKDAEAIHALLAPTYHILTGRSAQFHGADEEKTRWAELFRTDPTAVYVRTVREIMINEEWGIAEELGNWTGRYSAEGKLIQATGVYSAKWQLTENGEWVVQAEIFTTLTCDGPCEKPDPIYK